MNWLWLLPVGPVLLLLWIVTFGRRYVVRFESTTVRVFARRAAAAEYVKSLAPTASYVIIVYDLWNSDNTMVVFDGKITVTGTFAEVT